MVRAPHRWRGLSPLGALPSGGHLGRHLGAANHDRVFRHITESTTYRKEFIVSKTRFVAIVPDQGSAYYREPGGGLIQVPILKGGIVEVPQLGASKDGDEGEVDWLCAFESEADAESVRAIERALEAIPDDLADFIAPYRFNLSIRLGADEMNTPDHVVNALRQAADAIEAGDEIDGTIYTASGNAQVGRYAGCIPGEGKGTGRKTR